MKLEKYFAVLLVICMLSYFMMVNLSMVAVADDISDHQFDIVRRHAMIYDLKNSFLMQKELIEYICSLTNFEYDDSEFLVNECKNKNIDPFIVLGVIKRESDFNPVAQGAAGERGLGQLMENTAKPVAENLGYVYDPDKLFETRYNLKLTITQIAYLVELYNNDIHKALTAYNRGQIGLIEYMENNNNGNSAVSDYSNMVLKFAYEYEESFVHESTEKKS